jgi:galactose-1-phosphate uridylyltransferase
MEKRIIQHQTHIGKQKPNTLMNREKACPFCDRKVFISENAVVAEEGTKLLIENKYPVFDKGYATVLVETDTCERHIHNYDERELIDVLSFGINQWKKMKNSGKYKGVMFYKNHGPISGGSIYHAHMQIIGLEEIEAQTFLLPEYFEGVIIEKRDGFEWNVSNKPKSEFYEFNVKMENEQHMKSFCLAIQKTVQYIIGTLNKTHASYNLAFYEFDNQIICKIFSRFPTSPVFLGYSLTQVPNNIESIAQQLQKI